METAFPPGSGELALFVQILDEGYEKKAWHGPNLKGSIRGLSAEQAAWRPHPGRHSIAENVVHCAYWKYAVRAGCAATNADHSLSKEATGSRSLALERVELEGVRRLARDGASPPSDGGRVLPDRAAARLSRGGKGPFLYQLSGIALHDVYHAGQIQLLKRLRAGSA